MEYFLEKKLFYHFERQIQQNWRAENLPVVVGRLFKQEFRYMLELLVICDKNQFFLEKNSF